MRRGLTMTEILAAGAVVALLLGVLAPSLSGAMEGAAAARCAAGVRELQAANLAHSADDQGRFVAGAPGIRTSNSARWHGVRTSTSQPFAPEGAPLTRYLQDGASSGAVRECPSFSARLRELEDSGEGFERGCGGYGYNNAFVGVQRALRGGRWVVVDDERGTSLERFRTPSATIAFADAALAASERGVEYSFAEPRFWPDFPTHRPDPSIHFRHAGRAQVVWLDGHVSAEALSFTRASGLYPFDPARLKLGWFGEPDDNGLFDCE